MNSYLELAVMFAGFAIVVIMVLVPSLLWWADR